MSAPELIWPVPAEGTRLQPWTTKLREPWWDFEGAAWSDRKSNEVDAPYLRADIAASQLAEQIEVRDNAIDDLQRKWWAAEAERDRLAADNARWQKQSREGWEAFSAMRDGINEVVPMQSAEADLLTGPELAVSCEAVAKAVVVHVNCLAVKEEQLREVLTGALGFIEQHYEPADDSDHALITEVRAVLAAGKE